MQPSAKNNFRFVLLTILTMLSLFVVFVNLNLYKSKGSDKEAVLGEATNFDSQEHFWENFLAENPNYIAGWLELAQLEYKKGDVYYAQGALNTAKAINPNHTQVVNFNFEND